MFLLRLTHAAATHEFRLDADSLTLGASPTADFTLQRVGWPAEAARLRIVDGAVEVQCPGIKPRVLAAGEDLVLGGVRIQILEPIAVPRTPFFGGYDDDLPGLARSSVFELSPAGPAPTGQAASRPSIPPSSGAKASTSTPTSRPAPRPAPPPPWGGAPTPSSTPAPRTAESTAAATRADPAASRSAPSPVPELGTGSALAAFPDADFATALVAGLKRAPFWAISMAFHALLFVILSLILDVAPEDLARGSPAMAAMVDAGAEVGDDTTHDESELEELETPRLSAPEVDPLEAETDPSSVPQPPESQTPWVDHLPDLEADQNTPLEIGLMPSLSAASRRPKPARPVMPMADLTSAFGEAGALQGNREAARIVRDMLVRGGRQGKGSRLTDIGSRDILVVQGSFDHIERTLDLLALPYEQRAPWTLAQEGGDNFDPHKIVFWNCSENMLPARRLEQVARSLRRFVQRGGYLFTTDWCVSTVLEPTFPGYLQTKGRDGRLPEMVLDIQVTRGSEDHPLLDGVFLPRTQGKWWLEQASFDVVILKPDEVTVLMEAPALHDVYRRSPVLAATFNYGRGRVLHAVGHYFQEKGNVAGTVASHRLALNFVLMKLDQDKETR